MKKKILCALLTVCLVCVSFVFASCEKSPEKIINAAMAKTSSLDCFEAEMNMVVKVKANGVTTTVPMNIKMKAVDALSERPTMEMEVQTRISEQTFSADMYWEGDWVYVDSGEGRLGKGRGFC